MAHRRLGVGQVIALGLREQPVDAGNLNTGLLRQPADLPASFLVNIAHRAVDSKRSNFDSIEADIGSNFELLGQRPFLEYFIAYAKVHANGLLAV